jgi:hypothetical protein
MTDIQEIGSKRQMRAVLFKDSEGQQARALGLANRSAEVRRRQFFPMHGQFRLRPSRVTAKEKYNR